jgi:glycerol-3-phosphate dehydrogenase
MRERAAQIRETRGRTFDVIVIGGGINGAGIARDAAERGLSVLLLDQQDWGFGTTWRSTKLIHGGLRYLEHGEIPLVFESLRERAVLMRTAPHLVRPLPFLLPEYNADRHRPAVLRAGITLYDCLAVGGGLPRHRSLSPDQVLAAEPDLRRTGLRGGIGYWDCQVELPERLCLENVLRAAEAGALTVSYMRIDTLNAARGRIHGVSAEDCLSGATYEFRGRVVVNAAGPWVDRVLGRMPPRAPMIGGTRGSHLVIRFPNGGPRRAIYAEAAADRRPFFVIPWRGVHLIGTTDIRTSDPDDVLPAAYEIEYLFEATKELLPGEPIRDADVWYAYGGIRPLPYTEQGPEGAITRRHHVIDHRRDDVGGLYSVVGGKLTTARRLAAEVVDRLMNAMGRTGRSRTASEPLVPGRWRPLDGSLEEQRLWRIYGARGGEVLAMQQADPALAARLCPHTLDTIAQARYAIRSEGAVTVGDVLFRRTPTGWSCCAGLDAAPVVAGLLAESGAPDIGTPERAIAAYSEEVRTNLLLDVGSMRFE